MCPAAAGGKRGGGSANGRRHRHLEGRPVIGTPGSGVQQATARVSTEDSQGVQRRRRSARDSVKVQAAGRMAGRTWLKDLILWPLQAPAARKEDVRPSAGDGLRGVSESSSRHSSPPLRLATPAADVCMLDAYCFLISVHRERSGRASYMCLRMPFGRFGPRLGELCT